MMLRYAAVQPDGTIVRLVVASSEDGVEMNMPADMAKVAAPDGVMFGTHIYDFAAETFRPVPPVST